MSRRRTHADPLADRFLAYVPSYTCPNECCKAAIPSTHLFFKYPRDSQRISRVVQAFCEHCDTVIEQHQVLESAHWHPCETVIVADLRKKGAIKSRFEESSGAVTRVA